MQKTLEAYFYNENDAQSAITALGRAGLDTASIVLYTGGRGLAEQTYENTHIGVLGSATGFVYNTRSYDSTPSMDPYPLPRSTAFIADDLLRASHIFGIEAGSEVPHERVKVSGSAFVLTLRGEADTLQDAENILTQCGASRVITK